MLSDNRSQDKQQTTQQQKQEQKQKEKQEERNTNCDESEVAETISEEELLSIDQLCRLLYTLYREQQLSKGHQKHF